MLVVGWEVATIPFGAPGIIVLVLNRHGAHNDLERRNSNALPRANDFVEKEVDG